MLKTILGLIVKVLESKLIRSGLEEKIFKNKAYITVAKEVWNIVEENFRIAEKVDEKLKSKADEFDELLLAKFPELTQEDVANLRQSIAGEVNQGKAAVLDNSELLKKLQEDNAKLQAENTSLTEQLQYKGYNTSRATSNCTSLRVVFVGYSILLYGRFYGK